jgi:hypothetical protein
MSLNAYLSEQHIKNDDGSIWAVYYGFHISGTSFQEDLHPFTKAEDREKWIAGVESLLSQKQIDGQSVSETTAPATFTEYERNVIPALCMVCAFGDETAADRIEPAIEDAFPEYVRALLGWPNADGDEKPGIYDLAQLPGFGR